MLPTRHHLTLNQGRGTGVITAFGAQADSYTFGRYALVEALKRAGVGKGCTVLLPAFHCRTIVESALSLNANISFYSVHPDLTPNFRELETHLVAGNVRAMVLTHYFGFPNKLAQARQFCSAHGVALIEDCAHAFFSKSGDCTLGTVGDYAIASAWKFLPLRDGAFLRDNTGRAITKGKRKNAYWKDELKAVADLMTRYFTLPPENIELPPVDAEQLVAKALRLQTVQPAPVINDRQFDEKCIFKSASIASRWLCKLSDCEAIIGRRRQNYVRWLSELADIEGVSPLFPQLHEGVVPYAFPLLADADGVVFHALKMAGIPIWRWEDVAITQCSIANDYRLRLLQLPCHQDLSDDQIVWMASVLRGVMNSLQRRSGL